MKTILATLFIFSLSTSLNAQMFSLKNEPSESINLASNYFKFGYAPIDFSFNGRTSSVLPSGGIILPSGKTILPSDRLDLSDGAFYIGFHTPYLEASVAFINRLTGSDDKRFIYLQLNYLNKIAFIRSEKVQGGIPVTLMTNLISTGNETSTNEFSQQVFGAGAGVFSNFRFGKKIGLNLELTPHYGFSNSAAGLFGGTNNGLIGKASLNIGGLLRTNSISLGYEYKRSSYDIDQEEFDYDLTYHLLTLGISF